MEDQVLDADFLVSVGEVIVDCLGGKLEYEGDAELLATQIFDLAEKLRDQSHTFSPV